MQLSGLQGSAGSRLLHFVFSERRKSSDHFFESILYILRTHKRRQKHQNGVSACRQKGIVKGSGLLNVIPVQSMRRNTFPNRKNTLCLQVGCVKRKKKQNESLWFVGTNKFNGYLGSWSWWPEDAWRWMLHLNFQFCRTKWCSNAVAAAVAVCSCRGVSCACWWQNFGLQR